MSTATRLRPPTEDDLAEVVRLVSLHRPEPIDEDTVTRSWSSPNVDLARDARLEEGRACALARAGLGVDAESLTGAHRLYEQAGMSVSASFEIREKSLT